MGTLIRLGIHLVAVAVGLIVAALALDRVGLTFTGFLVAVVLFAIFQLGLGWVVDQVAERRAPELSRVTGLLTTYVALVVTTLLTDGLAISGFAAWLAGPLIVWAAILLATAVLPFGVRRTSLGRHLNRRESS